MMTNGGISLDAPVLLPDGVRIGYRVPAGETPRIRVYDLQGATITTLKPEAAGDRMATTTWDLRDASGNRVTSGVYLITIEAAGEQATAKVRITR
jgi:hypothetical protein